MEFGLSIAPVRMANLAGCMFKTPVETLAEQCNCKSRQRNVIYDLWRNV